MNILVIFWLVVLQCLLVACSPVKTVETAQFKLDSYSARSFPASAHRLSILITKPEAMAGYQTSQMLYMQKLYELNSFANNAWVGPPSDMLQPLITQSLQKTGFFNAVASSSHTDETDYRLDTQLFELQQNFLKKPSEIVLTVKVVLSDAQHDKVVASRVFSQHVSCATDTPYGGVLAANKATNNFTAELSRFVVEQVNKVEH